MTGPRDSSGAERGSATVLVLAAAAALLIVSLGWLGWAGALLARQRAESAADLAALAAAAAVQRGGDGCVEAERVAAANAAAPSLASCQVRGSEVEVVVSVTVEVFGVRLSPALARARAGVVT